MHNAKFGKSWFYDHWDASPVRPQGFSSISGQKQVRHQRHHNI